MKAKSVLRLLSLVGLALSLIVTLGQAQGPEAQGPGAAPQAVTGVEAVLGRVPIQGRLTDASGVPLNGTFINITLRLYDLPSGGAPLCEATPVSLQVSNGLFSTYIPCGSDVIDGRQLYLAVKVGADAEMTGRQPIYPVPYAVSLKPGAMINDNSSGRVLAAQNTGSGTGVYGYSYSGEGLYGWAEAGRGVYGCSYGGYGVVGGSATGVAIRAEGTGVIQSTAATDWVVSPLKMTQEVSVNGGNLQIVPSTQFGYVKLYTNGQDDCKALLPVDVAAFLFGTRVKLSSFFFCYQMDNTADQITQVDVAYVDNSGSTTNLCSLTTAVSSTTWACSTCTPASPAGIYGPVFVRFSLHFAGDGSGRSIRLGQAYLHLTE